jgi:hypothetical protein
MVKEFFVVGSDDHSNDNPKIGNTDLRHVSLSPLFGVNWIIEVERRLMAVIRKWTSKNGRAGQCLY